MELSSNEWQEAILNTLIYHNIFNYPLTEKEIWRFLLLNSRRKVQSQKLEFKIKNYLKELEAKKKIFRKDKFYFLPGRLKIVALRKKRKQYSREKIKIAQKTVKIIRFIPWLRMVAISGALAMKNTDKKDDIDFFIITAQNRLWLTRLFLIVILEILGKRRKAGQIKVKDKICLNMFLDESSLSLPLKKRNLFTAHEIVQLKPIFNRRQSYEKFLQVNWWLKKYLANGVRIKRERLKFKIKKPPAKSLIFDFLEKKAYKMQFKYMKSKITTESVSLHFAFFHPKDRSKEILKKYQNSRETYFS